jgi:divinyl protochlorophyllide a 8-vinyl-reductase
VAPADRALCAPAAMVGALRAAVLADPRGQRRLREAGVVAGRALWDAFAAWAATQGSADPAELPLAGFAALLARYTRGTGWWRLELHASEGAAVLEAHEWAEAALAPGAPGPACHFSTGLVGAFFGRLAGAPLGVTEVACAAAGAPACRFRLGDGDGPAADA